MRVDRLMSITMVLLDKKRISAQTLADMFEVSLRTIYRDIDAIDLAGIPVRSFCGIGGGFEIMPNYKLDKNVFSSNDLSTILSGLSSLSNMMQGSELVNTLTKVKSFIPKEQVKEIEFKSNQILIDLNPWMGNKAIEIKNNLELIKIALQKQQLVSFQYTNNHGIKTERTIESYQLILKGNHWYLYGFCLQRNDYRLFKLSRINNLSIQEKMFIPKDYNKAQLEFNEEKKEIQIKIKLRIHTSIMDKILDYCNYDDFIEEDEHHYLVDFPFVDNEYGYDLLFSFGTYCECLEPLIIREKMKQKILAFSLLYQD